VAHPQAGGTHWQRIQEWCTPTRVMIWLDLWWVYPFIITIELGFCWHTDSYRLAVYGGGAFELCLPSLGFFFTKLTLRCRFWAFADRMSKVVPNWWPSATPPCRMVRESRPLQHYAMSNGVGGVSALRASSHPVYYAVYTVQLIRCVWFDRRGR